MLTNRQKSIRFSGKEMQEINNNLQRNSNRVLFFLFEKANLKNDKIFWPGFIWLTYDTKVEVYIYRGKLLALENQN